MTPPDASNLGPSLSQEGVTRAEAGSVLASGDLITVCDRCLRASCWHGIFMCDEARNAGTVDKPRAELVKLGREHPSYIKPAPV